MHEWYQTHGLTIHLRKYSVRFSEKLIKTIELKVSGCFLIHTICILMPLFPGVFSIYSLDPKFIWLPRPKWLKQEMTQHVPGIGGVKHDVVPISFI